MQPEKTGIGAGRSVEWLDVGTVVCTIEAVWLVTKGGADGVRNTDRVAESGLNQGCLHR